MYIYHRNGSVANVIEAESHWDEYDEIYVGLGW